MFVENNEDGTCGPAVGSAARTLAGAATLIPSREALIALAVLAFVVR